MKIIIIFKKLIKVNPLNALCKHEALHAGRGATGVSRGLSALQADQTALGPAAISPGVRKTRATCSRLSSSLVCICSDTRTRVVAFT